ncbi:hypothetical protein FA13DRAFT_1720437 [Coprinellus micaceus]|uniref:Uncharacterized protein n=1 Tax=Coprinellus micaceus TaxID=71717 RepID=A0A4Y7S9D9_COPMI|nr:hypothetical protein FA13DRAFT_1720437 [Coprinellus micaceus]
MLSGGTGELRQDGRLWETGEPPEEALVTETEELSRGWMAELLQGVDGRWGDKGTSSGDGQRRGQGRCIRRGWLKTGARELRWGRMVGGGTRGLYRRGAVGTGTTELSRRGSSIHGRSSFVGGRWLGRGQRNFVGGGCGLRQRGRLGWGRRSSLGEGRRCHDEVASSEGMVGVEDGVASSEGGDW